MTRPVTSASTTFEQIDRQLDADAVRIGHTDQSPVDHLDDR